MKDSAQAYWMQLEPVDKDTIIATLHQSLRPLPIPYQPTESLKMPELKFIPMAN